MNIHRSFGLWTRKRKRIFYRRRFGRTSWVLGALGACLISFALVFVTVEVAGKAVQAKDPSLKPRNTTLHLTVPSMKRVKNLPVYTGGADDEKKLGASALHLKSTGFPWDEEANVYIAGHRLGYPRTDSFLVFYDLDKVKRGDIIRLRDARGRRYIYRVFNKFVTEPNKLGVTKPPDGENIVSLQTCTLPNYSKRLIVQGKLVKVMEEPDRRDRLRKEPARKQRFQEAPVRKQPAQARPARRKPAHASNQRPGLRAPGDRSRYSQRNQAQNANRSYRDAEPERRARSEYRSGSPGIPSGRR